MTWCSWKKVKDCFIPLNADLTCLVAWRESNLTKIIDVLYPGLLDMMLRRGQLQIWWQTSLSCAGLSIFKGVQGAVSLVPDFSHGLDREGKSLPLALSCSVEIWLSQLRPYTLGKPHPGSIDSLIGLVQWIQATSALALNFWRAIGYATPYPTVRCILS